MCYRTVCGFICTAQWEGNCSMKNLISTLLVQMLVETKTISEEEIKLYMYGIEQGITYIMNWSITIMVGILFGNLIPTLGFMAMYIPLRSFAGGFHAITKRRCFHYSNILVLCCEIIFYFWEYIPVWMVGITFLFGNLIIISLSPIQSKNKPLAEYEITQYKSTVFKIMIIGYICIASFIGLKWYLLGVGVALAFIAEAVLLLIAKIVKN